MNSHYGIPVKKVGCRIIGILLSKRTIKMLFLNKQDINATLPFSGKYTS